MKALNPVSMPAPFGRYSHGVAGGQVIVTSGQLGLAADGHIAPGAGKGRQSPYVVMDIQ